MLPPTTSFHSPAGLYLHIPFCLRKCRYCSFFSQVSPRKQQRRLARALLMQLPREARLLARLGLKVNTIFFGGGTPTVLPPETLALILEQVRHAVNMVPGAEISIEVNPASIDEAGLQELRRAGYNRLSIGVQSFADAELGLLGRPHSAGDAVQTVHRARRAGFDNLSLDLMYALPGQGIREWKNTLEQALALQPAHLSLYELTVESGTVLERQIDSGVLALPPEEEILAMMEHTATATCEAGLGRYEISNYCRPGHECRHNLNYWHNGDYAALGPGAVCCLDGTRRSALRDVAEYCSRMESGREPWMESETLDTEARFRETVIMGLRMIRGVSLTDLRQRFSLDPLTYYGPLLEQLIDRDLLQLRDDRLRLTDSGLLLANAVMRELV